MTDKSANVDDGEIAYEWYESKGRVAVVTVSRDFISWSGIWDGEAFAGRVAMPLDAKDLLSKFLPEKK